MRTAAHLPGSGVVDHARVINVGSPPSAAGRAGVRRSGAELARGDDALDPGGRVGDLGLGGQVLRPLPDLVEAVHAGPVDGAAHEALAIAVLPQLGVDAEQPAHHLLDAAGLLAPRLELRPDGRY